MVNEVLPLSSVNLKLTLQIMLMFITGKSVLSSMKLFQNIGHPKHYAHLLLRVCSGWWERPV